MSNCLASTGASLSTNFDDEPRRLRAGGALSDGFIGDEGGQARQVNDEVENLLPLLPGLVLGLALLLWPRRLQSKAAQHRARRMAELDSGSEETFFEERRTLEAYRPLSAGGWRILGALLFLLSLAPIALG